MLATICPELITLSPWSVLLRLLVAVLCGGLVGLERESTGRQAGFRTHILTCVGAAMAMMTNQYLVTFISYSDPARLGAGIISGISFLGAGTILVTRDKRVTGLTTAAGLWASATMGLAIGVGFYEAAVLACVIIVVAEKFMRNIGHSFRSGDQSMEMCVELENAAALGKFAAGLREKKISLDDPEIIKQESAERPTIVVLAKMHSKLEPELVMDYIRSMDVVHSAEMM